MQTLALHPDFAVAISADEIPASGLENLLAREPNPAESIGGVISGRFRATGSERGLHVVGSANWADARLGSAVASNVNLSCRTEAETLLLGDRDDPHRRTPFGFDASSSYAWRGMMLT